MICPLCETEFKGNQWHGGEFKGPFRICPKCDHRFKEPPKPRKPSGREKALLVELDRVTKLAEEFAHLAILDVMPDEHQLSCATWDRLPCNCAYGRARVFLDGLEK